MQSDPFHLMIAWWRQCDVGHSWRALLRLRHVAAAAALVLVVNACASAPRTRAQPADPRIDQALELASAGDTVASLRLLRTITDERPNQPEAYYWRAVLLSRGAELSLLGDRFSRRTAANLLEQAEALDPGNPRYPLELGRLKLKDPLLRLDANRMFRRALSLAEQSGEPERVSEVAWELGRIYERRFLSLKDRHTSQNFQVVDPQAALGRMHYVREFLDQSWPIPDAGDSDRAQAEGYFQHALSYDPTHALSALGLAGLQYDLRRYEEMAETLERVIAARNRAAEAGKERFNPNAPGQRAYWSSLPIDARLYMGAGLAAYRRLRFAESDSLFAVALAHTPAGARDSLLRLDQVLTRKQANAYAALDSADRAASEVAFWDRADPLLSTPWNEARLEYLARLAWADLRFSDPDLGRQGWLTDRGLIAIRYGEPPRIATYTPETTNLQIDALGRVATLWFYPQNNLHFVFYAAPGMNYASFAGDYRYHVEGQRDQVPLAFDNVREINAVDSVAVQTVRLRGTTALDTDVRIFADVPVDRLYANTELDGGRLFVRQWLRRGTTSLIENEDTLRVRAGREPLVTQGWKYAVPPGPFEVRVEATDFVAGVAARSSSALTIEPFVAGSFGVSDLLLAASVRPNAEGSAPRSIDDFTIAPRGGLNIAGTDTFALYFETYGLQEQDGGVSYSVQATITLMELDRGENVVQRGLGRIADMLGLTPVGEDQLGVQFDRDEALAGRDRIPQSLTLSLGGAPPGRYRMTVTVTDKHRGSPRSTQREFHVRRSRRSS